MRFMNPASLLSKLGKGHSKKAYELSMHEDDQVEKSKRKHGSGPQAFYTCYSPPKGCMKLLVGKEEKKYAVPHKYFVHPKFQELLKQYRGPVFDPKIGEPFEVGCSMETFEQLLHDIVRQDSIRSIN